MITSRRLPRVLALAVPTVALLATAACGSAAAEPSTTQPSTTQPASSQSATAQSTENEGASTVTATRLSVDAAGRAAQAALAQCQADGLGFVTVSVVDRAGNVQAMLRGDNAAEHTVEAARQKAYTAAAFGANTSDLVERTKGDGATIADLPGTLFLPGGVSVKAGNASIAGIGVGGAPDGMADQECAAAGLATIADSL